MHHPDTSSVLLIRLTQPLSIRNRSPEFHSMSIVGELGQASEDTFPFYIPRIELSGGVERDFGEVEGSCGAGGIDC